MSKEYYTLVAKKEQLLLLLNSGFIDDSAWVKFVYEARDADCHAMAENMIRRYSHYKIGQIAKEVSND